MKGGEIKYTVKNFDTGRELEPETFFVVKSTDIFAVAALYAYAHTIQTGLELDNKRNVFTDMERRRLIRLADHVSDLAGQWSRLVAKVPD